MKADYCEQIHRFFAFRSLKTSSVVQIQPSVPVFLRFRAFSCFAEMFFGPYLISFVRCSDHELTHWSIIQEYLAASACFHEIVNKLYVFCFSAATHERINVTCFEREVPCLYIVWISRTFVGSKIHNNPFCKSDIFFAHHYNMGGKSSTQMDRFYLTRRLPITFTFLPMFVHVWIFLEPLKCSSGHVEYGFDNHAETFSQEIRNFFWSKSENSYDFFSTKNSSKCSLGHVDCSFDNLAIKFFLKVLFAQSPKIITTLYFFK